MTEEQKNQILKECADDGWQILQDMADAIHNTPSGIMPEGTWPVITSHDLEPEPSTEPETGLSF